MLPFLWTRAAIPFRPLGKNTQKVSVIGPVLSAIIPPSCSTLPGRIRYLPSSTIEGTHCV
jgi:hypothetical protein